MIVFRFPILALCLFLCTCVSAQKIWLDGSYTLKNGETVSGQIADTYDGRNVTVIPFRADENAREQLLALSNLAAFSNTANRYVVRNIEVNTSPRNTKNLVLEANQTSSKTTGPLLLLFKTSSLSLYEYVDTREQNHYFLGTSDGEITYLSYARYIRQNQDGGTRVHNYDAYKVILNQRLAGSPELLPTIQKTAYKRSELVDLLTAHATAQGGSIEYERAKSARIFRFAALAAMGASNHRLFDVLSVVGGAKAFNWEKNYVPTFMIGGAVSTVTNEQSPMRFSFELNFITSGGKTNEELPDDSAGRAESRDREVSQNALQFRLGARYRVLSTKTPLYLEGGIMGVRILKFKESASWTREFGTSGRNTTVDKATGRGLYVGISTDLGPVELGLRYDNTRWPSPRANVFSDCILLMARYGLN